MTFHCAKRAAAGRLFLITFFYAVCVGAASASEVVRARAHAQRGGVRLYYFSGTPKERGRAQGALFKGEIRFLLKRYLERFLPGDDATFAKKSVLFMARQLSIPPACRREMEGIAEGAGISFDDVLLANTFFDLKKVLQCTTVCSQKRNGFFARNLDFPSFGVLHRHSIVVSLPAEDGHAFSMVTFPGFVGVLSGINSKGLSCAVMEVYGKGYEAGNMPFAFALRRVLETCGTLEEADRFFSTHLTTTGNNVMVCDAAGNAGVFELTPKGSFLRRSPDPYLYATNHFLSENARGQRLSVIRRLLKEQPEPSFDLARKLLRKCAFVGDNIQAMVFYPHERKLALSCGKLPASDGPYRMLGAPVLGFGCPAGKKKLVTLGWPVSFARRLAVRLHFDLEKSWTLKELEEDAVKMPGAPDAGPDDVLFCFVRLPVVPQNGTEKMRLKKQVSAWLEKQLSAVQAVKVILVEQHAPLLTAPLLRDHADAAFLVTATGKTGSLFDSLQALLNRPQHADENGDGTVSLYELLAEAAGGLSVSNDCFSGRELSRMLPVVHYKARKP